MPITTAQDIRVADEVWIAAALLQRKHPERADFTVEEIVERAKEERLAGKLRPSVYVHVVQHCVANRPPNPGRYRMLFETRKDYRRLFRPGDPYDPRREGSKTMPDANSIPSKYVLLLEWYEREYAARAKSAKSDPLLALRGSGKDIWADEHADEYVRRLRESWE